MTDRDRCPTCDRSDCPRFRFSRERDEPLHLEQDRYRPAVRDCEVHAVDWRARCLAAESVVGAVASLWQLEDATLEAIRAEALKLWQRATNGEAAQESAEQDRATIEALKAALAEAVECAATGWTYADEYSRRKCHDEGRLEALRAMARPEWSAEGK